MFAEGARTNGGGILSWKEKTFKSLESFEKPAGIALALLEYSKSGAYTPHHTVGSSLKHAFWLVMQLWHTVTLTWFEAADLGKALRGKSKQECLTFLRSSQVNMRPGFVELDLNAERLAEFMDYWDSSQHKNYTKQQKKA